MPRRTVAKRKPRRNVAKKVVYIKPRVPLNGVQNTEIIKLRYVETITIPLSTGGNSGVYNFRANSLYDPNITSTGHQPMGFDQMAAKYNHYQVLGARIKITPVITGLSTSEGDEPSWVVVSLRDNTGTDYVNFSNLLESAPYGKTKKVCISNYSTYSNNGVRNTNQIVLSAYYDPKKMFGLNKSTLNAEENLKALTTANPSEDAVFQIQAFPIGSNSGRDATTLLVEIDYTAKFSEPKQLGPS